MCFKTSEKKELNWEIHILGGPLVGQTDGKLIGVMSSAVTIENDEHTVLQIFINVPYYYGWIENVTGLKMPKC